MKPTLHFLYVPADLKVYYQYSLVQGCPTAKSPRARIPVTEYLAGRSLKKLNNNLLPLILFIHM